MRLLTIALAAILTAYALLGTFMRYEVDDYCQALSAHNLGAIGFDTAQYYNWQGRYTSTLVMGLLHSTLGQHAPAITPALLIGGMVGAWYYLLRRIRPKYALLLALVLTLGYIAGVPNLWQTVNWVAASLNYVLPINGALLFAGWLLRRVPSLAALCWPDAANNGA